MGLWAVERLRKLPLKRQSKTLRQRQVSPPEHELVQRMKRMLIPMVLGLAMAGAGWADADPQASHPAEKSPRRDVEEWVQTARQAAEQALQEMRQTWKAAQQKLAEAPKLFAQTVGAVRRERSRQIPVRPIRTLVASPRVAEAGQIAEMEEDLAVMSRLLAKDVEMELRNEAEKPMGMVITTFGDTTRAPEAVYLEGFGAFFYLTVDFPLRPAPEEKAGKAEGAPMDSDWDRTRAELFGGPSPEAGRRGNFMVGGREPAPPPAYDADKVENLKRVLLSCLRNAVNIRGMKPEDWVHVSVCSLPRSGGPGEGYVAVGQVNVQAMVDGRMVTRSYSSGGENLPRQGQLNLRVKRSDLQAYAEGKLTLEELRKKSQISLY